MPKATTKKSTGATPPAAGPKKPYDRPSPASKKSSPTDDKENVDPASQAPTSTKASSPQSSNTKDDHSSDSFLDITLEGEATHSVKIYDNCQEVRRKMVDLLQKNKDKPENAMPGEKDAKGKPKPWTKKHFSEVLGVSTKVLNDFMDLKGKSRGAESEAFYGGYVFFEKKRVFEKAKKSKKRLDVEEKFPQGIPIDDMDKWCKLKQGPMFMVMPAAEVRRRAKIEGKGILL